VLLEGRPQEEQQPLAPQRGLRKKRPYTGHSVLSSHTDCQEQLGIQHGVLLKRIFASNEAKNCARTCTEASKFVR